MKARLSIGERILEVNVRTLDGVSTVELQDPELTGEVTRITEHLHTFRTAEKAWKVWTATGEDGRIHVEVDGDSFIFTPVQKGSKYTGAHDHASDETVAEIRPPMPGRVVLIKVELDEIVEKDQVVAVVEAMKMEVELTTPIAGKVTRIAATNEDLIDTAQPLIVVERVQS